jgi:hypothetical protein
MTRRRWIASLASSIWLVVAATPAVMWARATQAPPPAGLEAGQTATGSSASMHVPSSRTQTPRVALSFEEDTGPPLRELIEAGLPARDQVETTPFGTISASRLSLPLFTIARRTPGRLHGRPDAAGSEPARLLWLPRAVHHRLCRG